MREQLCSHNNVDVMHKRTTKLAHFLDFFQTKINKMNAINFNASDDKNFRKVGEFGCDIPLSEN